ncbi:type IV pilus biogenesis/stability protein PilW [Aestuariibacter sp. AA17]|uniref:Type IV pilus biogenesis/stability protein PilW n=1 Tax=Fluctibacter corallii TaxID=2984329 RepID=A0ABT3A3D6_9ALTE|nr:type IV pilus biogenesis/stability protein PilW [Aestuariibacter sp. AA17]MCV2883130.1 type IV pilus biogenesis/stability protein PilW [Aestuariibacter sp. AA17]
MRLLTAILLSVLLSIGGCATQYHADGHNSSTPFDALEAAKTRISLGLTYLKNGNYKQAKFNLDKALEYAPRLAEAHYSIAYYYQVVGEVELADSSYKTAMKFDGNNPDIANTYGAFLCQQGQFEEAKDYFLKAVSNDRYNSAAETYENLALCSQNQGLVDEAIQYLEKALQHQPSRAKTLMLLAQLQASDQQWEAARRTLRRYESIARVSPDVLWLLIKIEEALGNQKASKDYGAILVDMYPGHPNAQDYLERRASGSPFVDVSRVDRDAKESQSEPNSKADNRERELLVDERGVHILAEGENLYRISIKYNVRLQKLIEWNDLHDVTSIPIGTKLFIEAPLN